MKNFFLLSNAFLLILTITFTSCKEGAKDQTTSDSACCAVGVKTDSLIGLWNDAWNTKNLDALKNMIAVDAVVLETDWKVSGRDSIMANWIKVCLPVISNLKTEKITECICPCCISLTAFYSHDFTTEERVVTEKGNFTFIWNLAEDKTWKLKLIHMDVFDAGK